jgi:hypothetical protein
MTTSKVFNAASSFDQGSLLVVCVILTSICCALVFIFIKSDYLIKKVSGSM